MPNEVAKWFDSVLQQVAAESYLDGITLSDPAQVRPRLLDGNNDARKISSTEFKGATRFTEVLAEGFLQSYVIVDHHANDASGFSATLTRNRESGEYTLSFRGTEFGDENEGGDWQRDGAPGADGEIFAHGFAFAQLASMETYYRELQDTGLLPPGAVLNVTGYSLGGHLATVFTELHANEIERTYTFNSPGRGTVSVGTTGLSESERIGEMLNDLLSQLEQADPTLSFFQSGASGDLYDNPAYQQVLEAVLGSYLPSSQALVDISRSDGPFGKITQLVGHATHGDQELVANSGVHATATQIFIEDQPDVSGFGGLFELDGSFGSSHSIVLILDSLALTELFHRVDHDVDRLAVEEIFAASSNQRAFGFLGVEGIAEGNSLESALDALRKLFLGEVTPTNFDRSSDGFGQLPFREQYYVHIEGLATHLEGLSLPPAPFRIVSLVGETSTDLALASQQELQNEYRYALQELNPFVVEATDATTLAAVYGPHNASGELDLFDLTSGAGTLTSEYLFDRALFLVKKIEQNLADEDSVGGSTRFEDLESGFVVEPSVLVPGSLIDVRIFGGQAGEHIVGGGQDDGLYGGGGDDTLQGQGGRDYLEGNAGDDILIGGGDADVMVGGDGLDFYDVDDVDDGVREAPNNGTDTVNASVSFALPAHVEALRLIGIDAIHGTGNDLDNDITGNNAANRLEGRGGDDLLQGGGGNDLYVYTTGDGIDQIEDFDGRNVIVFDQRILSSGLRQVGDPTNAYTSADGQFTYVLVAGELIVNNVLILNQNFQSGQFGIQLLDASAAPAGTRPPGFYDNGLPTRNITGSADNDTPSLPGDVNDVVQALGGNDWIQTLRGNDEVAGGTGNDQLEGGIGRDQLFGDEGQDFLLGEDGDDVLDGGGELDILQAFSGDDILLGGDGDDWLLADDRSDFVASRIVGNDFLDGGAGNDLLFAGLGDDRLEGGSGNDQLYGDNIGEGPTIGFTTFVGPDPIQPTGRTVFFTADGGNDFLTGGDGDDFMQGDGGDDVLLGDAGNDTMFGDDDLQVNLVTPGNDFMDGGAGADSMAGGGGADTLVGGTGADLLFGDEGEDTLSGGSGNDQLQGGAGDDVLSGDAGDDTLFGQDGNDQLIGGAGIDRLSGGPGDDVFFGGTEDDLLVGEDGDDRLFGEDGNDQIEGGVGADDLDGGLGDDVLLADAGPDRLTGGEGSDELQGGADDDFLFGGAGGDLLFGDDGDDHLSGHAGNDMLGGGLGRDTYVLNLGDGSDVIDDTPGEGNAVVFGSGITIDSMSLGRGLVSGQETLLLRYGGSGDEVQLLGFDPDNPSAFDAVSSFRFHDGSTRSVGQVLGRGFDLIGTAGDDVLEGGEFYDRVFGLAGNDQLVGGSGDNVLDGGDGNDSLTGAGGQDTLLGGAGSDTINAGGGADHVSGGDGNDSLFGQDGNDTLLGGAGDDFVRGGLGADFLDGGPGDDQLLGEGSDDNTLLGGAGRDTLSGSSGADLLDGGAGDDRLVGSRGSDSYAFGLGYDRDTIIESDTVGTDIDSVHLTAGSNPANVALQATQDDDLVLTLKGATDELLIDRFFESAQFQIEQLVFPDGVIWDSAAILANTVGVQLSGTGGADVLQGTAVRDTLLGLAGSDVLDGRGGADKMVGGPGDDTYHVDDPADAVVELAEEGSDTVEASLSYTLPANVENLTLASSGTGTGNELDNVFLTGFFSTNTLAGLAGDDTYIYNRFGGADTIVDTATPAEGNAVVFGAGISPDAVTFTLENGMLRIRGLGFSSDGILLTNFDPGDALGPHAVEAYRFSDGTVLSYRDLVERGISITGTSGDDVLSGTNVADRITGGRGNDLLRGGSGDDTYAVNLGDGIDTIEDIARAEEGNALVFGPGITLGDLDMVLGRDTLTIGIGVGGDAVILPGFEPEGEGGSLVVSTLTFSDRGRFELADVLRVLGTAGDDVLTGTSDSDILHGNAGNDVLDGGGGDDTLVGGRGDDTYVFDIGGGVDTVLDQVGENNRIRFGPGVRPGDLRLDFAPGTLLLNVGSGGDQVRVAKFDPNDAFGPRVVEFLEFADGTVLSYVELIGRGFDIIGAAGFGFSPFGDLVTTNADDRISQSEGYAGFRTGDGDDVFTGGPSDEEFEGAGGNDTGSGGGGQDSLKGGEGNDFLDGGDGADGLSGDQGNDTLWGGAGNDGFLDGLGDDALVGGPGHDTWAIGAGANTYRFNLGDGFDAVTATSVDVGSATFQFGEGIRLADIAVFFEDTLYPEDLALQLSSTASFLGFNTTDPFETFFVKVGSAGEGLEFQFAFNDPALVAFSFPDGTVVGLEALSRVDLDASIKTGGDGNDVITVDVGHDLVDAGAGDDSIQASAGRNTLAGGPGTDTLAGGPGDDFYVFNLGDGVDTILDFENAFDGNGILFGPGISRADVIVTFDENVLKIEVGNAGDEIYIPDFVKEGRASVSQAWFADGSVLDIAGLFVSVGTIGNDTLRAIADDRLLEGQSGHDRLLGSGGDDALMGGSGDDVLLGFAGNDVLTGGTGHDLYVFWSGHGVDSIFDAAETGAGNRIVFGPGIIQGDLSFSEDGDTLIISVGSEGDEIRLNGFDPSGTNGSLVVESLNFEDRTEIRLAELFGGPGPITGTDGDDVLAGTEGPDVIEAGDGNDTVAGGGGPDIIFGGAGNDALDGGAGNDDLHGQDGADVLEGADGDDRLFGGPGDDVLQGGAGNNVLFGATGNDSLSSGEGDTIYQGGAGNDLLVGGNGNNAFVFSVGGGTDRINIPIEFRPSNEDKVVFGGEFRALNLSLGIGSLLLRYGDQGDEIHIEDLDRNDVLGSQVIDLFEFSDQVLSYHDVIALGFDIAGTAGEDVLTGTNVVDRILGLGGDDVLEAGEGADVLAGGDGDDTLRGGPGADTLDGGDGNDTFIINVGDGVDTIEDAVTETDGNRILFGAGVMLGDLTISQEHTALTILVGVSGDAIRLIGFDPRGVAGSLVVETLEFEDGSQVSLAQLLPPAGVVSGTTGDDVIHGTIGDDVIDAAGGDDVVDAREGDDILFGGSGNDRLVGDDGADTLNGGPGADELEGKGGDDLLFIDAQDTKIKGGKGNDTVVVLGIEGVTLDLGKAEVEKAIGGEGNDVFTRRGGRPATIIGNGGADTISGGDGADTIEGGEGNDVLDGSKGADSIAGDSGNDAIFGGDHDDMLDGGDGQDTLDGGKGDDVAFGGLGDDALSGFDGDDSLDGGDGDDSLDGGKGDDILSGGAGADSLSGGKGRDTYLFERTWGQDTIRETGGKSDTVDFRSDLVPLDLVLSQNVNDLRVQIHGSSDQLTIEKWYSGSEHQTEMLQASDGRVLLDSQVDQLIHAMGSFSAESGLTWDEAIDRRPEDVEVILAAHWQ